MSSKNPLTPRDERFVQVWMETGSASRAYLAVGNPTKNINAANQAGRSILRRENIRERIAELTAENKRSFDYRIEELIEHWYDIATADPAELVNIKHVNCRHCWGKGFKYQWANEAEYAFRVAEMLDMQARGIKAELPSRDGGFGYDRDALPNAACPACLGAGETRIDVTDTRHLSRKGRRLYAGIKQTRYGVEIVMHDQLKALENLSRIAGILKTGNNETPAPSAPAEPLTLENMPDNQIDAMRAYQLLIKDDAR